MTMNDYDKEDSAGAQFNIGLATAIQIRNLLNECNVLSRRGEFVDWYNTLLTLNREICAETKYKKHEKDIMTSMNLTNNSMSVWQVKMSSANIQDVFKKLNDLEIEIRKAIKDCGLGMPDKEDDDGL